jgi:protein-S-isoprenylcysteine O-methyltransferase Ste14
MTGYVLMAIRLEERDLVGTFGERYRAYRRRVPGLVPRLPKRVERPKATSRR